MEKELWKPGNMLYPLPVVMVSCAEGGKNNIITVAWTGTVCTNPPMLSISVRPERFSYGMLARTGEFVVNLTTKKLVRACDYCGVKSGRDVDKFKETGLLAQPAAHVGAPLIAESPVNIECRVKEIIKLGSHDMFLAEVLGVYVDGAYLDAKGKFDLNRAEPVVYSHGEYYGLGALLGSFGYSVRKQGKTAGKEHGTAARGRKNMEKNNIVLIGMPGAGKSTVGVVLAKILGYRFLDSDLLIQEREGRLLCDIIAQDGLAGFLQIEEEVNAGIQVQNTVIATGGSAVYGARAMEHLKAIGMVVYLRHSLEEISKRIGDFAKRGIAMKDGQNLGSLYRERCPLYEKYADLTIDAEGIAIENLAKMVIKHVK